MMTETNNCALTYSKISHHSHLDSRPGRHSVDSCPHTVLWNTESGSPDRLEDTRIEIELN